MHIYKIGINTSGIAYNKHSHIKSNEYNRVNHISTRKQL